jgi:hypothetical protein
MNATIEIEPRNHHGQPVACASVWVKVDGEKHGGHWTAECPNLVETNPNDMAGERYRCSVCGYSFYLDYEDMK